MSAGLLKHYAGKSLVLGNASVTVDDLVGSFTSYQAQLNAAAAQRAAWLAATKAVEELEETQINPALVNLHRYLEGVYGVAGAPLADFGMTPRQPAQRSVKAKAEAIDKSLATRVARHTLGERQKAAIHGAASSPAPAPAPVTADTKRS